MILIRPNAIQEIRNISDWYNDQALELGSKFSQDVDRSINFLNEFPEMYQLFEKDIRRVKLSKFPYCLYYKIDKKMDIIILKCRHTKRLYI